jgi:hypothetical protein
LEFRRKPSASVASLMEMPLSLKISIQLHSTECSR